jgi:alpha-L-rhamnosidase
MTRQTFLSNIFSVQSDCPNRERFGYGGDLAVTHDAFMFNFDMATFYAKTVQDWQDAARPDGMLTDTAPFVGIHYCGVAWAMIHPLLQSQLYRYYGDKRLIEQQYPVSRKWLDLVDAQNPAHLISEGLSDHEGLEPAPALKLVTPLYVESARLLSRLAALQGRDQDKQHYAKLAEQIRKAYLADYLEPGTGRIEPVSQAGQVFALGLDILPAQEREAALRVLLQKLKQQDGEHLSTGIYGTRYLLEVLARTGHMEAAARIVRQKDFPGWGYMLENGATTLWEHWAYSDNTFSHNHPMFGSISEWFFKWMAGIQPHSQAYGFDRIVIRPQMVSDVDWAEAQYHSVRGKIAVRWDKTPDVVRLSVVIPANTSAEIFVPCPDPALVREGDKPVKSVPEIRYQRLENGCSVYQVGSGSYLFSFPSPQPFMASTSSMLLGMGFPSKR